MVILQFQGFFGQCSSTWYWYLQVSDPRKNCWWPAILFIGQRTPHFLFVAVISDSHLSSFTKPKIDLTNTPWLSSKLWGYAQIAQAWCSDSLKHTLYAGAKWSAHLVSPLYYTALRWYAVQVEISTQSHFASRLTFELKIDTFTLINRIWKHSTFERFMDPKLWSINITCWDTP